MGAKDKNVTEAGTQIKEGAWGITGGLGGLGQGGVIQVGAGGSEPPGPAPRSTQETPGRQTTFKGLIFFIYMCTHTHTYSTSTHT